MLDQGKVPATQRRANGPLPTRSRSWSTVTGEGRFGALRSGRPQGSGTCSCREGAGPACRRGSPNRSTTMLQSSSLAAKCLSATSAPAGHLDGCVGASCRLRTICPGAQPMTDGPLRLVHLPILHVTTDGNDVEVEGLLCLSGHSSYTTRLYLSRPFPTRKSGIGPLRLSPGRRGTPGPFKMCLHIIGLQKSLHSI